MLLAIDTTTKICSVALMEQQAFLAEFTVLLSKNHSNQLLPLIELMFKQSGRKKEQLDAVAVARGPGSFTGVRIGLATAAGFSMGLSIPAAGVITLDALASAAPMAGFVVPMMDARRGQVYTAVYKSENGTRHRLTEYMAVYVEDLIKKINSFTVKEPIYCLGDGVFPYSRQLDKLLGERFIPVQPALAINRAGLVAQEGFRLLEKNEINVEPFYIRLSDAERKRLSAMEGDSSSG